MAVSKVDICNAALGKLGQDVTIAALTDQTKSARTFARVFDRVRDYVIADGEWAFATKAQALAVDAQDVLGWRYRYGYPSDCLDALSVCTQAGARVAMQRRHGLPGDMLDGRYDFEVVAGDQGTSIATDLEDAYLIYVSRVTDTGRLPAHFVEAFACRLAIEVAPVIAAEIGLRMGPALEQKYIAAKSKAMAHARNESRETFAPMTPSLVSRFGI